MKPDDLVQNGEIVLEGTVAPAGSEEYFESAAFTAAMVRSALTMIDGPVTVRVNSPGGDPTAGEAIRVAFREHGNVMVRVTGDASSAASLMVMGAKRIEMSTGSVMMIHDPATITIGPAADHLKSAEMLNVMADSYASAYAERAGLPASTVRGLMRAETWLGPQDAVDQGFADAVEGIEQVPAEMSAAADRHRAALQMVKALVQGSTTAATDGGVSMANQAATQEANMPNTTPTAEPLPTEDVSMAAAVTTPPEQPEAVDVAAVAMAERQRISGIRTTAAPFMSSGQLTESDIASAVNDGLSVADASQRFMTAMARVETPSTQRRSDPARINRDETETRMEGMIGALMGRLDGPAEAFRGLRVRSLAMELGSSSGYNEIDRIRSGMRSTSMMGGAHGVSDFSYITTEVMSRTLREQYERRAPDWSRVTGQPMTASDFRELHAVKFGGDFQLKPVKENGEYESAVLHDEGEGLKVERRGRTIKLTFEAIVNDDMGAFRRIPREFAMAARVMEASMVWSIIRTNAVLKSDNVALFHTTHKNLASSGAAISVATVGAGRKAMWEQRAPGSKDKDDFLMMSPDLLLVPPALETVAGQFVTDITPAKVADVNPYRNSLETLVAPHIGASAGGSDTAWYLIDSDHPPIAHAYLEGYEAPTVVTVDGMNPDLVEMNARHVFGAAPDEFRGSYMNPGS